MHRHQFVEIVYHRSGRGRTRLKSGSDATFDEGSYVVYAPQVIHDQAMETPGEDLCVHIAIPPIATATIEGCLEVPRADPWVADIMDGLTSGRRTSDSCEQLILNLRATAVLLGLIRICISSADEHIPLAERSVRRAEAFVRKHYAEIGSLGEVAAHVGLSHDRLRHLFKSRRGMSLVRFLTGVRIERAKALLSHSNLPLKQIATLCGFRDEYYFSAAFRNSAGCPPGRYRLGQS